jgi:chaperonin cofactor prefoldin
MEIESIFLEQGHQEVLHDLKHELPALEIRIDRLIEELRRDRERGEKWEREICSQ